LASRHAHIVEEQLRGVLRLQPHLVELAAAAEALCTIGLHQQQAHALGPGLAFGLGHHDDQVGVLAVGDEGLGAVDQIVIAVAAGEGAHGLQVGAGAGLGHRDRRGQLARHHARQPALLLVLGAAVEQVGRDDGRMQAAAPAAQARARRLHDDHRLVAEIATRAAIGLGRGQAQQALRAAFVPGLARHDAGLAPGTGLRHPALGEEAPRAVLQHAVLLGDPGRGKQGKAIIWTPAFRARRH
jgi:hypothetical protein